jgi:hypothetical protein
VRFTKRSTDRYADWVVLAPVLQRRAMEEALFAVVDDTWRTKYDWKVDVIHSQTVHVLVVDDVWMTLRFATEYPTMVQLIYIGPLEP